MYTSGVIDTLTSPRLARGRPDRTSGLIPRGLATSLYGSAHVEPAKPDLPLRIVRTFVAVLRRTAAYCGPDSP
jgi:hypothetical protein